MKTDYTVTELLGLFAYHLKHCDRYGVVWCLEKIEDQTEGDVDQYLPAIREALANTAWRFALIGGATRLEFANYFDLVDDVEDSKIELRNAIKNQDAEQILIHEENLRNRHSDLCLMATPTDWKRYSPKQRQWTLEEIYEDMERQDRQAA